MKKKIILALFFGTLGFLSGHLYNTYFKETPVQNDTVQKQEKLNDLIDSRAKAIAEKERNQITETLVRIDESFTDTEIERLTIEDFINYVEEIRSIIPTNQELQNLETAEIHHFPMQVMEVGYRLGIIKRILAIKPEFSEEANEFYDLCAQEIEYPSAVRALCLTNIVKGGTREVNMNDFPEEVRELAKSALEL